MQRPVNRASIAGTMATLAIVPAIDAEGWAIDPYPLWQEMPDNRRILSKNVTVRMKVEESDRVGELIRERSNHGRIIRQKSNAE
jgi:hypothetical protein